MTDSEVQASSVATPAPGSKAQAPPPEVVRATAAMTRITQMEPGMELKLNAFMQWAGPIVLAALGIAPSACVEVWGVGGWGMFRQAVGWGQ